MKIRVSYYDEANDRQVNFDGTTEFDCNRCSDEEAISVAIDDVLDDFQADEGCTIDQGGDNDWYELDLVDFEPALWDNNHAGLIALCKKLLAKVEEKLP
jgi:hypothetical protein